MVRIAIVGARRRNQGLGEFLARFFHELGTEICGITASNLESARDTARYFRERYGIRTDPHVDLPSLFAGAGKVDGVAICSPHEKHHLHLVQAAAGGANALCEKPFIWGPGRDLIGETGRVLRIYREKKLRLILNTQWPFVLEAFRKLHPDVDPTSVGEFEMGMCPPNLGSEMVPDAVPHGISLLLALAGRGAVRDLRAESDDPARLSFTFDYRHTKGTVRCALRYRNEPQIPRPAWLSINGRRIDRVVKMPAYEVGFTNGKDTLWIEDPLRRMARHFLEEIQAGRTANAEEEILQHSVLIAQFAEAAKEA